MPDAHPYLVHHELTRAMMNEVVDIDNDPPHPLTVDARLQYSLDTLRTELERQRQRVESETPVRRVRELVAELRRGHNTRLESDRVAKEAIADAVDQLDIGLRLQRRTIAELERRLLALEQPNCGPAVPPESA